MKGGGPTQVQETLLANGWNSNFIMLPSTIRITMKGQPLFWKSPAIEEGAKERRNYHESIFDSDN